MKTQNKEMPPLELGWAKRFWKHVGKAIVWDDCWIWRGAPSPNFGYGALKIAKVNYFAHRLAWWLFRGAIPGQLCVLHRCDTPLCVNPQHLFLGTRRDNALDMMEKGRANRLCSPKGHMHGHAVLTPGEVIEIRRMAAEGRKQAEIAADFGISRSHVRTLIANRSWKHLQ